MVTAEEMGVTAANAAQMATDSCALTVDDPATADFDESGATQILVMCRLLTSEPWSRYRLIIALAGNMDARMY